LGCKEVNQHSIDQIDEACELYQNWRCDQLLGLLGVLDPGWQAKQTDQEAVDWNDQLGRDWKLLGH